MTSRQCSSFWRFTMLAIGGLFIVSGLYLYQNWIEMFTRLRGKEMALSPTSPAYPDWKISPLPLNFDVYLFNWTNPHDFYVGSKIKPHFVQLGPYRFRESPDKVDIVWHAHNHSVSFRKKAVFHFDAAGSNGTLTDKITSVNAVAHSAVRRAENGSYFAKKMLEGTLGLYNMGFAITKSAEEWIFKGYLDPFATMGGILSKFTDEIKTPYDRIGYLYTRNNSANYDGHFNMYTGTDDIYKMGQIHAWNYKIQNGLYKNECDAVKGSLGEFFPPNLSTNSTVSIFLPNVCRAVPLDYVGTVQVRGVTAYKFMGTERVVDNGTLYPEGKCFCVNDKCEKSGVFNISPCKYNVPIYMSYPHFFKADPSYLEAVDGLSPDPEKHEFYMTLEPNAGLPMEVGGGFQANYLLSSVAGIRPFHNLPRTFLPLMWAEERVRVTEAIASDIALVPLFVLLGQILTGALLAGGLILICWYPTKFMTRLCHDPKSKTALLKPLTKQTKPKPAPVTLIKTQPFIERNTDAAVVCSSADDYSALPLLEYRNGAFMRSDGAAAADELLGNALRTPTDVIIR